MQENESLRDIMKQFVWTVLQFESYSIDAIIQIFKWSIRQDTSFFESLTKKPFASIDNLFKQANKYVMLEDDVRATS